MLQISFHLAMFIFPHFSSRPQDIMGEIFKKLKSLGFEWKIINSYHIIVRQQNEQGVTIKVRCAHTHVHTHTCKVS